MDHNQLFGQIVESLTRLPAVLPDPVVERLGKRRYYEVVVDSPVALLKINTKAGSPAEAIEQVLNRVPEFGRTTITVEG